MSDLQQVQTLSYIFPLHAKEPYVLFKKKAEIAKIF